MMVLSVHGRAVVGAVATLLLAGTLRAQEAAFRGRVVDAAGQPVAAVPVVMHRVDGASGAELGRDTTDAAGEYEVRFTAPPGDTAGIYFGIVRHEGAMYVGAPVRGPLAALTEYEIRIAPEAMAEAFLGAPPPAPGAQLPPGHPPLDGALPAQQAGGSAGALPFMVGLVAALAALAALVQWRGNRRNRQRRELLLALAALEERYGRADGDGRAERARYEAEREELMDRLRALAPR